MQFDRLKHNPNGHGWISSDGAHWDYYGNAIGRQRWLNMQKWMKANDCTKEMITQSAYNQLERAMVVVPE